MIDHTNPEPGRFEALLTIEDVAGLLRMPVASLRYWRVLGTGPRGFIVGRRLRYRHDGVLAWIDACRDDSGRGAARRGVNRYTPPSSGAISEAPSRTAGESASRTTTANTVEVASAVAGRVKRWRARYVDKHRA